MVKSYKGVRKIDEVKTIQSVVVKDYMAKRLITFHPDQSISEVIEKLLSKRISGAPVVNDHNELVGVISEGDCLKEMVKGRYHNMPILSGKVSDHMAINVITIDPEVNILEAANMFLQKRIRRFPVIKDGKLIGQISQKDIMRAVNVMS